MRPSPTFLGHPQEFLGADVVHGADALNCFL